MINRCAERIDVGPRTLLSACFGVLLVGGVAGFYERRHGFRLCGDIAAGGSEVDQDRRAVFADDYVVRRDIAVQEVLAVNEVQRIEQRFEDCVELFLARCAAEVLEPVLEALAFLEVEGHVACVVRFEITVHAHDVRVIEFRKCLGFFDEAFKAPTVVVRAVLRARRGCVGVGACSVVSGKILFDRDGAFERNLVRKIGDAETTCSQHTINAVVVDQLGSARQRAKVGHGSRLSRLSLAILGKNNPGVPRLY